MGGNGNLQISLFQLNTFLRQDRIFPRRLRTEDLPRPQRRRHLLGPRRQHGPQLRNRSYAVNGPRSQEVVSTIVVASLAMRI